MTLDTLQLSNITDRGYLGPEATLAAFGPLLKRKTENPSATIVALFLNAVHEVSSPADHLSSILPIMQRLRSYMTITRDTVQGRNRSNPDFIRFMSAEILFRDFDDLFRRFECECRLGEICEAARLKMKSKNTIVQPWPMRIQENATRREFQVLLASGHIGSERYVEWKSAA